MSKIKQMIEDIAHSETKEDHEFQNLLDFLKRYSTFYDFPEAQAGGSRPIEPPQTNPPCTNPPYPRLNFKFLANMEANGPWLTADFITVLGAQHPLPKHIEKLLPKFDPHSDVTLKDHINKFMIFLILMDV